MSQTFLEDIPEFLEIQRNSFLRILDTGLIEALEAINPILPTPNCEYGLLFYPKEYVLVLPPHASSQEKAFLQGKTYGCKIYVPAIILNCVTEKEYISQPPSSLKGIIELSKELQRNTLFKSRKEWVCIGLLPLMNRRGHFLINGSPRIVISQMSRAPGLYYQTGEKLQATVVPFKGAWFRMSVKVSKKGETKIWVRITPYRKMPYRIFLETYKNLESPESFAQSEFLDLAYKSINNQIKDFDKQYGVGQIRRQIDLTIRNESSYTLGTLGRKRLNERLGGNSQKRYLTTKDISTIKKTLLDLLDQKIYTGPADDIDHLENRRVRTCGELLQSEIEVGMSRLKKAIVKQLETYYNPDPSLFMSPKGTTTPLRNTFVKKDQPSAIQFHNEKRADGIAEEKVSLCKPPSPSKIVSTKAFAGALREFFGSNPLSQYMDQTNPLAEITHKRRLSSLGPGGVDRASAGIAIRGIHPTHYGRICPIETPEGKNAGLVNSMTMWARLNRDGFLQTPYLKVTNGSMMTHTFDLSPAWQYVPTKQEGCLIENQGLRIVASDLKIPKSSFLPPIALPTREGSERNFVRRNRSVIDFCGVSPVQNISVATSLIPFLEHDDATRALMGSNMQRQAVPLLKPQAPSVRTGLEGKVVGESGHALQAVSSGFISSATKAAITIDRFTENKKSITELSTYYVSLALPFAPWKHKACSACAPSAQQVVSALPCLLLLEGTRHVLSMPCAFKEQKARQGIGRVLSNTCLANSKEVERSSFIKTATTVGYRVASIKPTSFSFFSELQGLLRKKISLIKTKQKTHKELIMYIFALLAVLAVRSKHSKQGKQGKQRQQKKQEANYTKKISDKAVKIQRIRKTQTLQNYTRSNQATVCVQRPAVIEGQWVQKGDLLADCSASSHGILALGQNIVIAYLPMEGFNFEDAIVVSDRLVHEELYTSIHVERVEFDMEAVPKKNILLADLGSSLLLLTKQKKSKKVGKKNQLLKVKANRNTVTAAKTLQQDWITAHNPHLHLREKEALDALGIIKIGSWVGPDDVLVSKVFPVEKALAPSRHLLLAVFKDKKSELASQLETTDTSVRVPRGIHGRVINIQIQYTGKITPSAESAFITSLRSKDNTQALTDAPHREPLLLRDIVASRLEKAKQNNRNSRPLCFVYSFASKARGEKQTLHLASLAESESKALLFVLLTICFASIVLTPRALPFASPEASEARAFPCALPSAQGKARASLASGEAKGKAWQGEQSKHSKQYKGFAEGENDTTFTEAAKEKQHLDEHSTDNKGKTKKNRVDTSKKQLVSPLNSTFQLLVFVVLTGLTSLASLASCEAKGKARGLRSTSKYKQYSKQPEGLFIKTFATTKEKADTKTLLQQREPVVSSQRIKQLSISKQRLKKGVRDKEFKIVQVRVYIAERKKLQVGDKMSGRHGNKGIVSTILPREDMPYLPDGSCVDMVLNPLGIPSRMNVGQVFECLLGLATTICGDVISHTPFDEMYGPEASRSLVYLFLYSARLRARADYLFQPRFPGKTVLFDGRTGTPFEQWVTVGRAYMLKLIHMVDEKIHARSVGSRSIVTQQPVKGRARGGGQRVGEMEVWAFEGFGAAYTLQELLTIKSDDIFGRERVEDRIISSNTISAHVPETFKILLFELRCLCLNVELNAKDYPKKG